MRKNKRLIAAMVCVMVMALSGCASGNEPKPDTLIQTENFSTGNDNAVQNKTDDNMQPDSPKNDEDMTQQQTDTELEEELKKYRDEEIYIIGGESVYRMMLPYCQVAHVTKIDHVYEADAYFPNLDESEEWEITADSDEQTYFDIAYSFIRYERKNRNEQE